MTLQQGVDSTAKIYDCRIQEYMGTDYNRVYDETARTVMFWLMCSQEQLKMALLFFFVSFLNLV